MLFGSQASPPGEYYSVSAIYIRISCPELVEAREKLDKIRGRTMDGALIFIDLVSYEITRD
jgi:hypothetical protein